jgi:serine/threonine protein kinase
MVMSGITKTKTRTKSQTKTKKNARQLNINTIIEANTNLTINTALSKGKDSSQHDIDQINTVLNNNISPEYKIIKYLGQGINGNLYLATDNNKDRFVVKKIHLDRNNNETNRQMNFELGILNYLSSNEVTRPFVNPCLEHKIFDNQVYTIFPVFDGYSVHYLSKYLTQIHPNQAYKIIFHLIKAMLFGLAKIHQSHIAHQNINEQSILVSTYNNPKEITVKFTDFGLGCGEQYYGYSSIGTGIRDKYIKNNDEYFNFGNCKTNNNTPVDISPDLMKKLSKSEYLAISQKYDILALGIIIVKLLLFFKHLDIDVNKGYSSKNEEKIKKAIKPYLVVSDNSDDYDKVLPEMKNMISNDTKRDVCNYLDILNRFVFCKTGNRKKAQYVLDKIIVYEKYKYDEF